MSQTSMIEWTEATWNPVTGCTKISTGCKYCYAERMAKRLQAMGVPQYARGFDVVIHPELLARPKAWKRPRLVFVNSMSDLFHERVPFHYVKDVFEVMNACPWHRFQVLTKRPHIAAAYARHLKWTGNIWMGTTVEDAATTSRIEQLGSIPSMIRFVSLEPLLSPVDPHLLRDIDWVIVGGESGPHARPMKIEWVREIRDYCVKRGTPFFFKQWGGVNKKKAGRTLDGKIWDEMPGTRGTIRGDSGYDRRAAIALGSTASHAGQA